MYIVCIYATLLKWILELQVLLDFVTCDVAEQNSLTSKKDIGLLGPRQVSDFGESAWRQ